MIELRGVGNYLPSITKTVDAQSTDLQVPTAKAVYTSVQSGSIVEGKEDKSNKVSAWSATTTDAHYPSEKLVKDSLDTKANSASLAAVATSGDYDDLSNKPSIPEPYTLPTASTSTLGGVKVDGSSITINNGTISSTGGLFKIEFDLEATPVTATKTFAEVRSAIGNQNIYATVKDSGTQVTVYSNTSTSVVFAADYGGDIVYIAMLSNGNITTTEQNLEYASNKVSSWSAQPNDTRYPSEKLVKDSLNDKEDKRVHITATKSGSTYSVDKTFDEIVDILSEYKEPYIEFNRQDLFTIPIIYRYVAYSGAAVEFSTTFVLDENPIVGTFMIEQNGTVTYKEEELDIPTKTSDLTNDSGFLTEHQDISGKADINSLSAVAFSGEYYDLTGTPTPYMLPTASTATLGGVKVDGTSVTIDANGVISASGGGGNQLIVTFTEGSTYYQSSHTAAQVTSAINSGSTVIAKIVDSNNQVTELAYAVKTDVDIDNLFNGVEFVSVNGGGGISNAYLDQYFLFDFGGLTIVDKANTSLQPPKYSDKQLWTLESGVYQIRGKAYYGTGENDYYNLSYIFSGPPEDYEYPYSTVIIFKSVYYKPVSSQRRFVYSYILFNNNSGSSASSIKTTYRSGYIITKMDGTWVSHTDTTPLSAASIATSISSSSVNTNAAGALAVYDYAQPKSLKFTNVTASNWVEDTTYTGFGYKCDITATGATADDIAEVIFGITEATSGNYAPICEAGADIVTIYSKVNTSITIPTVEVLK